MVGASTVCDTTKGVWLDIIIIIIIIIIMFYRDSCIKCKQCVPLIRRPSALNLYKTNYRSFNVRVLLARYDHLNNIVILVMVFKAETPFRLRNRCSRFHHENIHPYKFYPLKPNFCVVKLGFIGVYIIFLTSALNHRLWVQARTASAKRFYRVPTIYVLSRNMKKISEFSSETFSFWC